MIYDASAPTIFSSRVDAGLVDALRTLPNITGASPEVFAFVSWNGVSFVVRGQGGGFGTVGGVSSAEAKLVVSQQEYDQKTNAALVGKRLLDRLDISLPAVLPLVGSYSAKIEFVNVLGSFELGTAVDDELVVGNEVARHLAGMQKDEVSIIRVSTNDPAWLSELLSPDTARFTLYDLHVSKAQVGLGEWVSVTVGVRNWGGSPGSATVSFASDGWPLAEGPVFLAESSSTSVTYQFRFQELGRQSIEVSISGDFPVKLYTNVTVVEPYLNVAAPSKVLLGTAFNVTVTNHTGDPVEGSVVGFMGSEVLTDAQGKAELDASAAGTFQVSASGPGYESGAATVIVADPSSFPSTFDASIASFHLSPLTVDESESSYAVVVVENGGTVQGIYSLIVSVDSQAYYSDELSLDALTSETVTVEIHGLTPGTHVVQAGAFSDSLTVQPWFADDPDLVQLVLRYGGETSLSSSASVPIYQAAKISEGNVAVALVAIGSVSALLAFLAITSVFSKEIHEGRRRLGVLRTIGAPRSAVRRLVFPQALENGLAGAAIGLALGVAAADTISKSGAFILFGHELSLGLDTELLLLILLGAVAISVVTALVSAMLAVRETALSSIRRLDRQDGPSRDEEVVLDDP